MVRFKQKHHKIIRMIIKNIHIIFKLVSNIRKTKKVTTKNNVKKYL